MTRAVDSKQQTSRQLTAILPVEKTSTNFLASRQDLWIYELKSFTMKRNSFSVKEFDFIHAITTA